VGNPILFQALFALGCILPLLVGGGLVLGAAKLARNKPMRLLAFAPLPLIAFVFFSFLIYFSAGGGFGPGTGMFFSCILAAIGTFVLALVVRPKRESGSRWTYWLVACLLVPLCFLAVPIGNGFVGSQCNQFDREIGMKIISALESYMVENGAFPKNLDALVPKYMTAIPKGPCHPISDLTYSFIFSYPSRGTPDFSLCKRNDGHVLLRITDAGGGFFQGYDLQTKQWQGYDNLKAPCTSKLD
jgi:hypothetical protein